MLLSYNDKHRGCMIPEQGPKIDPLLLPFLNSTDDQKSEELLQVLLQQHADPIIRRGIKRKLFALSGRAGSNHPERNVEDLHSETRLNLLRALRQMKGHPGSKGIHNFSGYVSAIVRQVCDQQLRRLNPNRSRLESQLRYLCSHYQEFAIWEIEGVFVVGKAAWKDQKLTAKKVETETIQRKLGRLALATKGTKPLIGFCRTVFEESKGPIELDEMVRLAEAVTGISVLRYEPIDDSDHQFLDTTEAADEKLHQQRYFQALWTEIVLLPSPQRTAILLGLKDPSGASLLPYFPLLQVATIEDIAYQFSFSRAEFAKLWNNLPLPDKELAQIIGVTTQQVANLRKCARERLTRRLKKFSE
jgi:DNA-directed RNA polymerase specialized sigma24 family protein